VRQTDNLIQIQMTKAERAPDDIAFSFLDADCNVTNQLSNQQLHQRAVAIAGRLQQIVNPSDRILLLFPQGLEFIFAFMGALYAGVIPVITAPPRGNTHSGKIIREYDAIVEETNVNIVLTCESILNDVTPCFFKSKKLSEKIILTIEAINQESTHQWCMPSIDKNSVAYLQRTSAGRETPTFVTISHENMTSTLARITDIYELKTSSRSFSWLPHYHYLGLTFGVLGPLYCGCRGYLYSEFTFFQKPCSWLTAISRYQITFSGAPNFAYGICNVQVSDAQRKLLDLSTWETAYSSAEPVNAETVATFYEKFSRCGLKETALTSIYGLAESALVISNTIDQKNTMFTACDSSKHRSGIPVTQSDNNIRYINSVSYGLPSPDTTITIVNPETRTPCGEQELGEIHIKSVCTATGYWNAPEKSRAIFTVFLEGTHDGPYLRTGDLGFIKDGEIHVVNKLDGNRQITQ